MFAKLILRFFKSRRTASMHTVTALTGITIKNLSYVHRDYPVYDFGGVKLVPIEALQGGEQNFEAANHFQRQAKDVARMLPKR